MSETASVLEDGQEFVGHIIEGDNPIDAAKKTLDSNKDGKITLSELKEHKWFLVVALFGIGIGLLIGNSPAVIGFVILHWMALLGMIGTYLLGWASYWLFLVD